MSIKPISVTPKAGFAMIPVGTTKGYELLNSGELESYRVGRARRITVASIEAYVARQLSAAA